MNIWSCLFGIVVIGNIRDLIMYYQNNEGYKKGYADGYKKGCENSQTNDIKEE